MGVRKLGVVYGHVMALVNRWPGQVPHEAGIRRRGAWERSYSERMEFIGKSSQRDMLWVEYACGRDEVVLQVDDEARESWLCLYCALGKLDGRTERTG